MPNIDQSTLKKKKKHGILPLIKTIQLIFKLCHNKSANSKINHPLKVLYNPKDYKMYKVLSSKWKKSEFTIN